MEDDRFQPASTAVIRIISFLALYVAATPKAEYEQSGILANPCRSSAFTALPSSFAALDRIAALLASYPVSFSGGSASVSGTARVVLLIQSSVDWLTFSATRSIVGSDRIGPHAVPRAAATAALRLSTESAAAQGATARPTVVNAAANAAATRGRRVALPLPK